jgi:hypothetical protein
LTREIMKRNYWVPVLKSRFISLMQGPRPPL